MKRRIISFALAIVTFLSCVLSQSPVFAADVTEKQITVDVDGTSYKLRIYEGTDSTIYVPAITVAKLGGMANSASGSDYIFYYKSETSRNTPLTGARRVIIDKSGKTGKVVCYTSSSAYTTIENITFSKAQTINNTLYLPIEEFLPLLNAKVDISSDGIVHIYKNPVSAYRTLLSNKLDVCLFNADDIVLKDGITATGLIVDSILGLKFDRLDFITKTGAIKDYSSLFKKFLTDNETYLSAFDKEETPLDRSMALINESAGDLDDAIGGTKDMLKLAEYMSTSPIHDTYKTFSSEVKQLSSNAAYVEGAIKVIEYADAYYNQVDDHRKMLTAVYSGSSPAAVAANEVYSIYGKDVAQKITGAATSALRNYITKDLSGAIIKNTGLTPYKIAFSAVKLVIPGAVKEFSKAAELFFLEKVVDDAYAVSTQRLNNIKFDKNSLENLRLSLIMTLVASKYGYETHYSSDRDEVEVINDWLEQLYLAADSVECVSKGYYATKKKELTNSKKYIVPSESTIPDNPSQDPSLPSIDSTETPEGALTGTCGDNLSWTFYNGTLTISGTGEMDGYYWYYGNGPAGHVGSNLNPWEKIKPQIQTIIIEEGVTSIGFGAFWRMDNLVSITISSTVSTIEDRACAENINLTTITYQDTIDKWNAISKWEDSGFDDNWDYASPITEIICTDGTVPIERS